MNSQQELLEAINSINNNKDKSFDTPAQVLRVEGETVWVHIDGGADETPVTKTVNCEEGDTVQVRISNGSAFLVGNASAPPTDDKTANVAHFVAEQASETAEEAKELASTAIKIADELVITVEGKVDSGDSNISDLSSTMLQNSNGVNIYNNTLHAGDSYAHIDGDSFDIKKVTTAGTIDDTNDKVVATFGATSRIRQTREDGYGRVVGTEFSFSDEYLSIDEIDPYYNYQHNAYLDPQGITFSFGSSGWWSKFGYDYMFSGRDPSDPDQYDLKYRGGDLYVKYRVRTAALTDYDGNSLLDEWHSSTATVSSGSFTFSGLDDTQGWGFKPFFEVDDNSSNLNPSYEISSISGAGTNNMSVTYTTDADNNSTVHLRIFK